MNVRRQGTARGPSILSRAGSLALVLVAITTVFPGGSSRSSPLPVYTIAGGRTIFTGTETKLIRVRFPEPLRTNDLHFEVDGGGRVFGFLMRKVGYYGDREGPRQEGARPTVWGTAIGQCKSRGCTGHEGIAFVSVYNVTRFAGSWDFYFVGDGAEVNVTLRVHGVPGTKTIDVDEAKGRTVVHEIRDLSPRVQVAQGEPVYSAGDFSSLKHLDFGMLGLWTVGSEHVATAYGPCLYYGRSQPGARAAFTPGCPDAKVGPLFADAVVSESPPDDHGGIVYVARSSGPPDAPRGIGGWFATSSEVRRYGAVALWIDYPDVDTEYR